MGERVLVADDDRDICRSVEVILQLHGFEVTTVFDGLTAVQVAHEMQPDLVVVDAMMPGLDGFEVVRALRDDARTTSASIVMLTARALVVDKVAGLEAGCDDYIVKPFDPIELVARVQSALRRSRQLREVSPLTGLPGNFQIAHELERLVADPDGEFAVLYLDIDNFKAFNDRYGFLRGDEVIRATGRLIADLLDAQESHPAFAGHIGGDDFVVVTSPGAAEPLAAAIVAGFDELAPSFYDDEDSARHVVEVADRRGELHRYPLVSISIGVVTTANRRITSQWEASTVATEMKQLAKRAGRSSYEVDRRKA